MAPKQKKKPPASTSSDADAVAPAAPHCRHLRIIAEPTKVPDQVAFRCLDCEAQLPPDFASPAH